MEIKGFSGVGQYTKGHIQLVLKVGPIVVLTRFHVVDSVVPYHILLGRPWLHKHQLIPFTYHQCVKGRLNDFSVFIYYRPNSTFNSNRSTYPAFLAATPFLHFSPSSAATPQFLLHLFNQILLTLH
jgi:hypothetical protein